MHHDALNTALLQGILHRDIDGNRRSFLTRAGILGCGAVAYALIPRGVQAKPQSGLMTRKTTFKLHHMHTGETLHRTLSGQEMQDPVFQKEMNHFMRDWRTGEVYPIDPDLITLLSGVIHKVKTPTPLHIVSGYRSPKTNRLLKQQGRQVAKKSFHMTGKAVDLYIPGTSLRTLRNAATSFKKGGVGVYERSGFMHMDVRGKPVYW